MSGRVLSERRRIEVEQGIARGWTAEHIARTTGCTVTQVEKVRLAMDLINAAPDGTLKRKPKPAPAPQPKPSRLAPCGTHSAFDRHRRKGEDIDLACARGERLYQAARWKRRANTQRDGAA